MSFDFLNGHNIIPVVAIVGGITVAIVWIIFYSCTHTWISWRKFEAEAVIKQELIKQGRSAEEIERILRAQSDSVSASNAE